MTQISQLRPGHKVKFYRPHDKQHPLTGTVKAVQKNGNMVRIQTDETGGNVSRLEEAHCDDVTFLDAGLAAQANAGVPAEWSDDKKSEDKK